MNGSTFILHADSEDLSRLFCDWFGDESLVLYETLGKLNCDLAHGVGVSFALSRVLRPGAVSSAAYAIAPLSVRLQSRQLTMRDGSGYKKALEASNECVVGLRFGGETGEAELQPTVLTHSGDNDDARELFKRLKRSASRLCRKIDKAWLMPGAERKLRAGWALPRGQFQALFTVLRANSA